MKNTIQLSIPNPCTEKWENFTPTSNGGFCSSCYKTVIDFTKMSDAEIMKFLKDKPAHTCGRFRADQLKEYTELPVYNIRPSRMLLRAGLISLFLALVAAKPSFAQTPVEPVKKEMTTGAKSKLEATSSVTQIIRGVIKDEEGYPIPGTNIVLAGTSVGMITGVDGNFEFPQALKEGDVLQFSFIGYKTKNYRVRSITEALIDITMELDVEMLGEVVMVGAVSVTEPYAPKKESRSLLSVIKRWF